MLVLSRGVGEQIVIDAAICVTVVAICGNKVRLGVTAPGSVRVDRAEVHERRGPPGRSILGAPIPPPSCGETV